MMVAIVSEEIRKKQVLFVDDEPSLAALGAELLDDCGYSVTCEFDGEAALRKFQEQEGGFDLVITDESMPKMSGIELAQAIFKLSPSTPIILCSGHMLTMQEEGIGETNILAVLAKTEACGQLPTTVETILSSE